MTPAIGDAVVIEGRKLRIRELSRGNAHCSPAGPHWRTAALASSPAVRFLVWDKVAGVWRLEAVR